MDFSFGPCIDDKSKEPFLPIPVEEAMEIGAHVPLILGCNTREGILMLMGRFENNNHLLA